MAPYDLKEPESDALWSAARRSTKLIKKGEVMKTLKEQIAVMQAEDEGEQIEIQPLDGSYPCEDKIYQAYDWNRNDYRVKPKPMEIWVNVYKDGVVSYTSKKEAIYYNNSMVKQAAVKFIQAPDD